ncbi:hypothetical protein BJX96DRAFT_56468 [Aspergillus floccosus]
MSLMAYGGVSLEMSVVGTSIRTLLAQDPRSTRSVSIIRTNDQETCCGTRKSSEWCSLILVARSSRRNGKCRRQLRCDSAVQAMVSSLELKRLLNRGFTSSGHEHKYPQDTASTALQYYIHSMHINADNNICLIPRFSHVRYSVQTSILRLDLCKLSRVNACLSYTKLVNYVDPHPRAAGKL